MRLQSLSPVKERNSNNSTSSNRRNYKLFDCRLCDKNHPLRKCLKFKRLNVCEKLKIVKRFHYCENCLAHSHQTTRCHSSDRCRQCGNRHHTLLHRHQRLTSENPYKTVSQVPLNFGSVTLLPTIVIKVQLGIEWANVRGMLNPCATESSLAQFIVERYKLQQEKVGVTGWCKINIKPRFDDGPIFSITAQITNDLPIRQPKVQGDERIAKAYNNLRLADPKFYKKEDINILLGADIYPKVIKATIQAESIGSPIAQDTVFGWTIIGKISC